MRHPNSDSVSYIYTNNIALLFTFEVKVFLQTPKSSHIEKLRIAAGGKLMSYLLIA